MKRYTVVIAAVGLFIALVILSACQTPGLLPTPTPSPAGTLTISIVTATIQTVTPAPAATLSDDEVLDIAATVFRHITHYNDATRDAGPMVYLTLFGEDPSPEFLSRFANPQRIRGGSEFVEGKGLKFFIDRVERTSENRVEVSAGYVEGPLSAAGYTYILELRNGQWVVLYKRMLWIS